VRTAVQLGNNFLELRIAARLKDQNINGCEKNDMKSRVFTCRDWNRFCDNRINRESILNRFNRD